MKNILFCFIWILPLIGCGSSEKNFPREDKKWEGWAGSPDKPGKKPFDYFYVKSVARASQKSIERQSELMLRESCSEAGTTTAKADLVAKIAWELPGCASDCYEQSKKSVVESNMIKETKLKECKPIAAEDSSFKGSQWKECECILYAYILGGKDTLLARIKELEK